MTALSHSPADVLRYLLRDLGLGTLPTADGAWPIYVANGPDTPDQDVVVTDTAGIIDAWDQTNGKAVEHYGVQVKVRGQTHALGFAKAEVIRVCLDETIGWETTTVSGSVYLVHSVTRKGSINIIGKEPGTKRHLFTINAVISLRQTT